MQSRPLTLQEQVAGMRATWPRFRKYGGKRRSQSVRWIGTLKPQLTQYRVEIRYTILTDPQIRVLSPVLTRLPGNVEGELPHIYPPANDPSLCLYDPDADEWDVSMSIAQTIVPWTVDWLACYEWWLITGRWTGGGRHVDDGPGLEEGVQS